MHLFNGKSVIHIISTILFYALRLSQIMGQFVKKRIKTSIMARSYFQLYSMKDCYTTQKNKILELPPEILLEILRFCNRKELIKLQAVNRTFYSLISNYFDKHPLLVLKANLKYERGKFSVWKQNPSTIKRSMWINIDSSTFSISELHFNYDTLVRSKFLRFSTNIFVFLYDCDKDSEDFVRYAYPLRHLWASMTIKVNANFTLYRNKFLFSKIFSYGVFDTCYGIKVNNLSYNSMIDANLRLRPLLNLSDLINTQLVYITYEVSSSSGCKESIVNWLFKRNELKDRNTSTNERILLLYCRTVNTDIEWIQNNIKEKFLNDTQRHSFHFARIHCTDCHAAATRPFHFENRQTDEMLISWDGVGIDCDGHKYNVTVISRCTRASRPIINWPFSLHFSHN